MKKVYLTHWDKNYLQGRYNKYPYNVIVSEIARYYYGISPRNSVRILDFGFGGGNHVVYLAEEGFECHGIDISKVAKNITAKRLREKGLKARLITGYRKKFPYQNNYFDCVIDRASLQHNSEQSIESIVEEIFRVLKNGGRYIGVLLDSQHPLRLSGKRIKGSNAYKNFSQGAFAHSDVICFFSKKNFGKFFGKFEIEKLSRYVVFNDLRKTPLLESSEYLIVAKKKES